MKILVDKLPIIVDDPSLVKTITFTKDFNQPIDDVNWNTFTNLENIIFHHYSEFNYPIEHIIFPNSLKNLILNNKFNKPMKNIQLPPNIEYIDFGVNFNHSLENMTFPNSLKRLKFSGTDVCSININNIQIPDGVRFDIGVSNNSFINNLPYNLEYLYISILKDQITNFPIKLKQFSCLVDSGIKFYDGTLNENVTFKLPYGCEYVKFPEVDNLNEFI